MAKAWHGIADGACDLNHMCARVWCLPDCFRAAAHGAVMIALEAEQSVDHGVGSRGMRGVDGYDERGTQRGRRDRRHVWC
jgi:hypothetical protein